MSRTFRTRSQSLSIFLLAVAGAASAAGPPSDPERRAAAQACHADAERLCAGVESGGGRRMTCLRDHAAQLSPACRDGLAALRAARKADAADPSAK